MLQVLRTHGGYGGVSDAELLAIPYARFVQAARVAAEAAGNAADQAWKIAAFVGWQGAGAAGALKKGVDFGAYLRSMNLVRPDPLAPERRAQEIAAARANAERVRVAFAQRGVA